MKKLILATALLTNVAHAAPNLSQTISWLNNKLYERSKEPFITTINSKEVPFDDETSFEFDNQGKNDLCDFNLKRVTTRRYSDGKIESFVDHHINGNLADIYRIKVNFPGSYKTKAEVGRSYDLKLEMRNERFHVYDKGMKMDLRKSDEIFIYFQDGALADRFRNAFDHASKLCRDKEIQEENDFPEFDDLEAVPDDQIRDHYGMPSSWEWAIHRGTVSQIQYEYEALTLYQSSSPDKCVWEVENKVGWHERKYQINFRKVELMDGTKNSLVLKTLGDYRIKTTEGFNGTPGLGRTLRTLVIEPHWSIEKVRKQKYMLKRYISSCKAEDDFF